MVVKVNPRARVAQTATAKKAPAKKAASAAPASKTAARSTPTRARKDHTVPEVKDTPVPAKRGRPRKAVEPAAAPVKRRMGRPGPEASTAPYVPLNERREAADPKRRIGGLSYKQLSELSGYGLGSEQFIAMVELVRGGETKLEVNHRVAGLLPAETRNGTPKQVSNLISSVIKNLESRGFQITGTWKMAIPKA